jgi:hypothetical protein
MTIFSNIQINNIQKDNNNDKYNDDKYIDGMIYIYNNFDNLMMDDKFKNFITNSESILHKYHKLFNTNDRKEVIAKYVMLSIQIFLS